MLLHLQSSFLAHRNEKMSSLNSSSQFIADGWDTTTPTPRRRRVGYHTTTHVADGEVGPPPVLSAGEGLTSTTSSPMRGMHNPGCLHLILQPNQPPHPCPCPPFHNSFLEAIQLYPHLFLFLLRQYRCTLIFFSSNHPTSTSFPPPQLSWNLHSCSTAPPRPLQSNFLAHRR